MSERAASAPTALRARLGPRPTIGAGAAARAVAEDTAMLVQAEIALAKAEFAETAKAKGVGAGLGTAAAILGWLAVQALLVTAGLALALVLPGWAAAAIVTGVLLLAALALGLGARRLLRRPAGLEATSKSIEEDVAWARQRLRR